MVVVKCQRIDAVDREHCGLISGMVALPRYQSAAPKAPMIPAMSGRIASQSAMRLKAAQDGIIVEGTALYDDMSAKLCRIGDLDYLI